jgi:hypothetical protein
MADEQDHRAHVAAWMARAAENLPAEGLVLAFEEGFGALWRRAHQTLGNVTLAAILDRVLHYATEKYPMMSSLEVEANGLHCEKLLANIEGVPPAQLRDAIEFVMVEFLTVMGNLTADILSPSLHVELSTVAREHGGPEEAEAPEERQEQVSKNREDARR